MNEVKTVYDIVRKAEQDDIRGKTTISKYVTFSLRENIEKIDAYLNSKHTSGETDSLDREKPFFNIVTAAVNIWYRATDIDRKNIRVRASREEHYMLAFTAEVLLKEWMKKTSFGQFLNEWGRVLSRYGSAVCKFVEKEGELFSEIVPWNRLICDPVDFENNVKIEKLWLTPAQLRKRKEYDEGMVERLLDDITTRTTMDGARKDNKSEYIPVYEVHGELPLSYLTDDEDDDDTFVQQMHVITFFETKDEPSNRGFADYSLYSGKESKCPYMMTHLIAEDGRTMGIGAVEHLFEAQWMVNHNAKLIKDQLDLASKLIFQTSDGNFVGQNALNSIETGDILIHSANQPLTQINNTPNITSLQGYMSQWKELGNEVTGVSESMMGENPPSGTAWRLTQALLQESHSLFEMMIENKGLYIEEMLREWVIPNLKKKMNTSEEISTILEDHQVIQLDSRYVPNEAVRRVNDKIKNDILNKTPQDILDGNMFSQDTQAGMIQDETAQIQGELNSFGNQRFLKPSDISNKTWKQLLKDFEWKLDIDVTGENQDKEALVQTLTTVLQTIAANPAVLQDPNAKLIFNRILETVGGLSPIELSQTPAQQPIPQEAEQVGGIAPGAEIPNNTQ